MSAGITDEPSAMTRATAVVVTSDRKFGSECQRAFREVAIFPVVVCHVARAVSLLREFRADVVVLESSDPATAADDHRRMVDAAGDTPLLVCPKLPPPSQLAAAVRDALEGRGPLTEAAHI